MDIKTRTGEKAHIHIIARSFFKKLPLALLPYPLCFGIAFLFSRAIFFGSIAPFGLAISAALGNSSYSLFGLLGATFGYLSVLDKINSLKYIACIILIFTAHFVFSGTSLPKKQLFTPLSIAIPATCINFVFIASGSFSVFDIALSFLEISLAAVCAFFLSKLADRNLTSPKDISFGLLTLAAGLISSLSGPLLFDFFSVGRTVAFLLIILCAFCGGIGAGACSGVIFGTCISLSLSAPEHSIALGVCGICSALFSKFGKPAVFLSGALSTLCMYACLNHTLVPALSAEFLTAGILFFLTEKIFSKHTRRFFINQQTRSDIHLRAYATERLNHAADAFRSLGSVFSELHRKEETKNLSDVRNFFEKSSRTLCKSCSLSSICWDKDFESTRDAFTKAGDAIVKNGALQARDFPIYFSSRCLNTENIVSSVNREIFAMRYRSQFDKKLRESREILTRQYSDAATIFSGISLDISNNARFDEMAEAEIADALTRRGILCDTAVYRDAENHINIHLCGRDLKEIEKNYDNFYPIFSSACKAPLTLPKYTSSQNLDDIVIREKPRLRAVFGAAVKSRSGASQSGDSGTLFYPANGKLALLLSDGMGSGKLAARESAENIKLLSELLRSGLSPKNALSTLQSALLLRSEFTYAFATLDLLYADMFSGHAEFYKLGGAPTYIKRGDKIRRITASSLPAGITLTGSLEPDITQHSLLPGDFVIMTSDGIADGTDDVRLLEFLVSQTPTSAKALADELLAFSLASYGKNDDMTVAVIAIESEY